MIEKSSCVEHLGFQKQYGDSNLCVFNRILLEGNGMFAAWNKEWFWLLLMCSSLVEFSLV